MRTSGWDVYTTLDMKYQRIAENAVRESLKEVDKQLGYRHYDCASIYKKDEEQDPALLESYEDPSWYVSFQEGVSLRGLVTEVTPESISVRIKDKTLQLDHDNMKWVARRIKT